MSNKQNDGHQLINPEMTVLDVVAAYKETLSVFKEYDALAKECICCKSLFETIHSVSAKYGFDLNNLLDDLEAAAKIQFKI
ncbi:MAG: hypothetical protein K8S13_11610 [Desulfobacula sp.]|uniref:hypothetical protein n=1 Tax=Desulfobacula sp. TaxID=2593537 RepID=UPI0025BEFAFC|nr:hypothetical protein [Desulfobacula sp.]MCD4720487.1 hypothetical protein [Desulfobacula sp.]